MVVPQYNHIVVVVEENHSYSQIIGSPDALFINGTLVKDGALMTNYTAVAHPSEPNYLALYAGSTFGVTDDNYHPELGPSLYTALQMAGKSFTGYVEAATEPHHKPWEQFPEGTSVEKDISAFPTTNFASLPSVSFVVPDNNDDMHDGPVQQGDAWLQHNLAAYEQWAKANNSLLVTVWDENDGSSGNHIAAIFDGAGVTPGTYADSVTHYNLLSTIAAAEGIAAPRDAGTAAPITSPFTATPTPTPISTVADMVDVTPGMDIQAAINANPAGTLFRFAAGTYTGVDLTPKDNDYFQGVDGTVLDGQNHSVHAFTGSARNVTIDHFVVRNYTAPAQDAPIHGDSSYGWIVKNNEIAYNAGGGVDVGDHMQVLNNNIHHNLQIGIDANNIDTTNGHDIVVDSNEIAFNNYTNAYDPRWEAGGTKFWATTNLQLTNNYVHDNNGAGLWCDTNNIGTLYDHNRVENNAGPGIEHEASYDATITNNLLVNNSKGLPLTRGWPSQAGIEISSSGGSDQGGSIEISKNMVLGGPSGDGIGFIAQDRSADPAAYGPHVVRNVHIHDNTVDLSRGAGEGGGSQDIGDHSVFLNNNTFDHNTYYLGSNSEAFNWMDQTGNVAFWQGYGQDQSGVFYHTSIPTDVLSAFHAGPGGTSASGPQ